MFRRKRGVVQNEIIARRMERFFRILKDEQRPEVVAKIYAHHLWSDLKMNIKNYNKLSRPRFNICLSTGSDNGGFDELTKRATLISDTLLLSHDWTGKYHDLGINLGIIEYQNWIKQKGQKGIVFNPNHLVHGIHCPDLAELGGWILDVEPLLKAGLVWYLPSYSIFLEGELEPVGKAKQVELIDYLIRDGRRWTLLVQNQ